MIPLDSATSRDILATFGPEHAMHSMDGAETGPDRVTFFCSCGQNVVATADSIKALESADWTLAAVKDRLSLKKLGHIGRAK